MFDIQSVQVGAWIGTVVAAITGVIVLGFTLKQLRLNMEARQAEAQVREASFWLELRKIFADYDDVHVKLKPGDAWGAKKTSTENLKDPTEYRLEPTDEGPSTTEQNARLDAYMGLFEHCEIMLRKGLIDEDTFRSIYRYRLTNLMWNREIVEGRIKARPEGWQKFRGLLKRLDIELEVREPIKESRRPIDESEEKKKPNGRAQDIN